MKIKDIVEIINKNQSFCNEIGKYHENLSKLNYLDMNGEFTEFAKTYIDKGGIVEPALIDYDKKIISYNKPRLDKVLKEYKEWLETEIQMNCPNCGSDKLNIPAKRLEFDIEFKDCSTCSNLEIESMTGVCSEKGIIENIPVNCTSYKEC